MIAIPAKTFSLVAYLLLTSRGEPASRSTLRQFFWGNSDAKTAATNLRKFLWRLGDRQEDLGLELVRIERNHVELAEPLGQIDLARFQQIVSGEQSADLVTVCDLYRGDLLEGVDCEEIEPGEWLQVQRTKLREIFVTAVSARLEGKDRDADSVSVRSAARRLIEVDPYNEAGHRALMQLFAEEGEPARVREIYRGLEKRLRDDLNVDPDRATKDLYRLLLPNRTPAIFGALDQQHRIEWPPRSEQLPASSAEDLGFQAAAASASSGAPKISVLPPMPTARQDFSHRIAVSLIDDVTIGLCRFKSLSVVAPHTAWEMTIGGKKALFKTFAIDYAIESQLQHRGTELYLSVQLMKAASREIIWTEQYLFDFDKAARHYRDLSIRILTTVVDRVERSELAKYDAEQAATPYHLYLNGQRLLRTLDLPNVRRARRIFKAAANESRDFVPAISGLAKTFHLEWLLLARGDSELLSEAERLARLSLEIDPDDARGFRELGVCHLYLGRFDESLEAFGEAEAKNPRYADLLMDYADALTHACEPAASLEKITAAIELNPLCPDSYWWAAAGANFYLQRYSEAKNCLSRMRDGSPAYRLLAASCAMLGDREGADEYVRRAKEIHPDFRVSEWLAFVPIRDPAYRKHYEDSLRLAGFE